MCGPSSTMKSSSLGKTSVPPVESSCHLKRLAISPLWVSRHKRLGAVATAAFRRVRSIPLGLPPDRHLTAS
jgi:hypothetical protein